MLGGWRFVSSLGPPELYEPSSSSKVRCWPRLPQTQCLCLFSACPPTRLSMRPGALSSSIPSSPCFPADATRLLIPTAGPIHRQPRSGGRRSAQGGARAIGSLWCRPVVASSGKDAKPSRPIARDWSLGPAQAEQNNRTNRTNRARLVRERSELQNQSR